MVEEADPSAGAVGILETISLDAAAKRTDFTRLAVCLLGAGLALALLANEALRAITSCSAVGFQTESRKAQLPLVALLILLADDTLVGDADLSSLALGVGSAPFADAALLNALFERVSAVPILDARDTAAILAEHPLRAFVSGEAGLASGSSVGTDDFSDWFARFWEGGVAAIRRGLLRGFRDGVWLTLITLCRRVGRE